MSTTRRKELLAALAAMTLVASLVIGVGSPSYFSAGLSQAYAHDVEEEVNAEEESTVPTSPFSIELHGIADSPYAGNSSVSVYAYGDVYFAYAYDEDGNALQYNYLSVYPEAGGYILGMVGDRVLNINTMDGRVVETLSGDIVVTGNAYLVQHIEGEDGWFYDEYGPDSLMFIATIDNDHSTIGNIVGKVSFESGGSLNEFVFCEEYGIDCTDTLDFYLEALADYTVYESVFRTDETKTSFISGAFAEIVQGQLTINQEGTANLRKAASGYSAGSHTLAVSVTGNYNYNPFEYDGLTLDGDSFTGTLTIDGGEPVELDIKEVKVHDSWLSISYSAKLASGTVSGKLQFGDYIDFASAGTHFALDGENSLKAKIGKAKFDTKNTSTGSVETVVLS